MTCIRSLKSSDSTNTTASKIARGYIQVCSTRFPRWTCKTSKHQVDRAKPSFSTMGNKTKTKKKGTYSTPHILEKHVGGHVTARFKGEASKSRCRRVGGGVGMCTLGTGRWRKEKDMFRDCRPIYSPMLSDSPRGWQSILQNDKLDS